VHQTELPGNLLIVASSKHFIEFLHSLVVRVNVLSLRVDLIVEFVGSSDDVFSLDYKIVKVLLLVRESGASGILRFVEPFLYLFKTLQIDQLAEL